MARFAAIENGVVVGVLAGSQPPTTNVPKGRTFVDVTEHPAIQGGEFYDGELFSRGTIDLAARVDALQTQVNTLSGLVTIQKVGP